MSRKLALQAIDYFRYPSSDFQIWEPKIFLSCRDPVTKERVIAMDKNFRPYAYMRKEDMHILGPAFTPDLSQAYKALDGETVYKIKSIDPGTVGQFRRGAHKQGIHVYEADILFVKRYLIDKNIMTGIEQGDDGVIRPADVYVEPRVMFLDIEADADRNTPKGDYSNPLIGWTVWDNYTQTYYSSNWWPDEEGGEARVLQEFIDLVIKLEPDVFTAWNVAFDMSYIIFRLSANGIDPDMLSPLIDKRPLRWDRETETHVPMRIVKVGEKSHKGFRDIRIPGREVFDLLRGYGILRARGMREASLEQVAREEGLKPKIKLLKTIKELWREKSDELWRYNKRDVEIMVELDKKMDIIAFFDSVRRIAGSKLDDTRSRGVVADLMFLREAHKRGIVCRSKPEEGETTPYKGAIVIEPVPGLYKNILVMDFKSLYPTIVRRWNISPDVKSPKGDVSVLGVNLYSTPRGILPTCLDELLALRTRLQDEMVGKDRTSREYRALEKQQEAVKFQANSIYGILGWAAFRGYDPDLAGLITGLGRECLEFISWKASMDGHKVIYGDTDSIFLETTSKAVIYSLQKALKLRYGDSVILRPDKEYTTFIILSKKRYAGIRPDGSIYYRGIEARRSDCSECAAEIQVELLRKILYGESEDEVSTYLEGIKADFLLGKHPLSYIGIPQQIGKRIDQYKKTLPQHVRAAKYSEKVLKHWKFDVGDHPRKIYIKVDPKAPFMAENIMAVDGNTESMPIDIAPFVKVDWEKMLEKTVSDKVEEIVKIAYPRLLENLFRAPKPPKKPRKTKLKLKSALAQGVLQNFIELEKQPEVSNMPGKTTRGEGDTSVHTPALPREV